MKFIYLCDRFSGCKHYEGKHCESVECRNTTDIKHALCSGCKIEQNEKERIVTRGEKCKGNTCPFFLEADKDFDIFDSY